MALSIGFVMQNGDALADRYGAEVPLVEGDAFDQPLASAALSPLAPPGGTAGLAQVAAPTIGAAPIADPDVDVTVPVAEAEPTMPEPPEELTQAAVSMASLGPIAFQGPPATSAAVAMTAAPAQPSADTAEDAGDGADAITVAAPAAPAAPACETSLSAEVGQAALVTLRLDAVCLPDAQATIHHQGMIFTLVTDATGSARVVVPALAERAVFIASFDGGDGAVATAEVPAIANYDRAVLQWQGDSGLQIHALEFGADYGSEGHVWAASARTPSMAIAGEGGFLTSLGDGQGVAPLRAEVYTFPSAVNRTSGDVVLSVEAEITDETCERDVSAQSIQISPGSPAHALDLTMAMPECSAVGDFLVLKNMLEDLTLAAR
ncbi:hypothetical protein [Roseisalinus antarcticus]|uniref:hypothetical protein n=1 Tax=Roseisalinus antarcticus TaxID=254357 RepID=UPI000A26E062|nr:hypothetical protein [Roseisalinus antarcticus]